MASAVLSKRGIGSSPFAFEDEIMDAKVRSMPRRSHRRHRLFQPGPPGWTRSAHFLPRKPSGPELECAVGMVRPDVKLRQGGDAALYLGRVSFLVKLTVDHRVGRLGLGLLAVSGGLTAGSSLKGAMCRRRRVLAYLFSFQICRQHHTGVFAPLPAPLGIGQIAFEHRGESVDVGQMELA